MVISGSCEGLAKEESIGVWPKGTLVANPSWVCKILLLNPVPESESVAPPPRIVTKSILCPYCLLSWLSIPAMVSWLESSAAPLSVNFFFFYHAPICPASQQLRQE